MKFNCSKPSELIKEIKDLEIKMVDMRFTDVPGTSFGDSAENFIRISYANSMENLEKAIYRLSTIWKKLKL